MILCTLRLRQVYTLRNRESTIYGRVICAQPDFIAYAKSSSLVYDHIDMSPSGNTMPETQSRAVVSAERF